MNYNLASLIDLNRIQELLVLFSRLTGVGVAVLDDQGVILAQAGRLELCTRFHLENPLSAEVCLQSYTELINSDRDDNSFYWEQCPHGLIHGSSPIIIAGKAIARLFVDQFFLLPPDLNHFRHKASNYDFDPTAYLQAINKIPVISQDNLTIIAEFLSRLALMLTSMGEEKITQLRETAERQRAEKALQKSERMYRDLYDNASDLLLTTDLAGNFTSLNRAALSYLDYTSEEITKMSVFDIAFPEYQDLIKSKINAKTNGVADSTNYEIEIMTRCGDRLRVELHTRLIYDDDRPIGIQGIARDITQQKLIQAELIASEQKFRTLAEDTTAIIFILQNNCFTYVNPALENLTSYSEEELLQMNFWEIVHPDHQEMIKNRELARQSGMSTPDRFELKLQTKNGATVWIYLTGSRITFNNEAAVLVSALDITELKHWDEALQESQIFLNSIIDFLPDATLVINCAGQILAWNRAMEKITGLNAEQMIGKDNYEHALPFYGQRRPILIDLVMQEGPLDWDRYPFISQYDKFLTTEIFIPDFGPQGSYLWAIATPIYNANGEMTGAIESIRDVTDRKKMELELINQTESLRLVLEHSPAGIAVIDQENRILFLNSRAIEIIGYELEDIPTMELWLEKAYPNPKSRQSIIKDWINQFKRKQKAQGQARVHNKNGQVLNIDFHGILLPDGRTVVSMWDMTWQKQVEEALRASEARFKAFSDASFEGIILSENQICIEANQKAAQMFEYDYEEMIGLSSLTFIAPESVETVKSHMNSGYELPYEITALTKNGVRLPVEVQGRLFEYKGRKVRASAIRDLSERKKAEAEIYRQSQNLSALFYNSPDGLVLCDLSQHIIDVNPYFSYLFGYNTEECRGKFLNELIVPPEYMEEYSKYAQAIAMGQTMQAEIIRQHKDGHRIDVMLKTVPIANFGFYVIYSDISTRKQAEQIITQQLRELEAKNAEMEQFTYTVSHDLRSPLITIKGFAGMLLADIQAGHYDRLEKDLLRIINAAGKMDALLHDLLELSRIGRLLNAFSRFSMSQLAMEVAELLTGRLQEGHINLMIDPNMPTVWADEARIREVLQNLVENASKFTGNQDQPIIEVGYIPGDEEWTFFVRDNGIGIESRFHDSIFGLFNKLNPNCEGTGIGLSLVRRIIEFHNGRIWVESSGLGTGSTFYFTLPRSAETNDGRTLA